jgi:predicted esterase
VRAQPAAKLIGRALGVVAIAVAVALVALPPGRAAPALWNSVPTTFGIGEETLHLVDHSRWIRFPGHHRQRRPVVTEVLYPVGGRPVPPDRPLQAAAAGNNGRFPLIVFGHGFNVTPATYSILLQDWVRAGFVVAAPVFPLGNHNAPGGANEADLINQPTDMSFVITQLLHASARANGVLSGLINPHAIAVAGQSDGGSTALAVAYNRTFADRRIGAVIILSGARIPGLGGYTFANGGPPVLAVQGTADPLNAPASTYHYFDLLRQPKFLLRLWGAGHLSPYTTNATERRVVAGVSIAFIDRYLEHRRGAAAQMSIAGNVSHVATLSR